MSEKDSNKEQEFPEIPPFPFDNELEMLKKMREDALRVGESTGVRVPDEVKKVLELKIKLLEEKEQENNT